MNCLVVTSSPQVATLYECRLVLKIYFYYFVIVGIYVYLCGDVNMSVGDHGVQRVLDLPEPELPTVMHH